MNGVIHCRDSNNILYNISVHAVYMQYVTVITFKIYAFYHLNRTLKATMTYNWRQINVIQSLWRQSSHRVVCL